MEQQDDSGRRGGNRTTSRIGVSTPTKEMEPSNPIDILSDSNRRTPFNTRKQSSSSSNPTESREMSTSPTSIISPAQSTDQGLLFVPNRN
jgi:hypothetical protein